MNIEKKMLALSVFAITIGVAIVVPMTIFMSASGQIVPCFEADVPYAYVSLYEPVKLYDPDGTKTPWDGVLINGVLNFTLTSNAADLRGANAQIEFYRLNFCSEQGSILNMTCAIAVHGRVADPNSHVGFRYAIAGLSPPGIYQFIDGTTFDAYETFGSLSSTVSIPNDLPDLPFTQDHVVMTLSTYIPDGNFPDDYPYDIEEHTQALYDFRNAQELYVTVSKLGSVSYKGLSDSEITITTLVNEELIRVIEFTKIDGGFICGNYVDGTVPFPMKVPPVSTVALIPQSTSVTEVDSTSVHKLRPIPHCVNAITTRGY